jgi:hypothetical protein
VGRVLKARDPQTFLISARPPAPSLHSPAGALFHWAHPPALDLCFASHAPRACHAGDTNTHISLPLSHDPKAGTALQDLCSASTRPQGLLRWRYKHAQSPFCWATTPMPAQPCKISAGPRPQGLHSPAQYSLCKPVPLRPAKPGTHTRMISVLLDLSSQGSTDTQDLHSASLCPSGTPSPCSKGPLLHLS